MAPDLAKNGLRAKRPPPNCSEIIVTGHSLMSQKNRAWHVQAGRPAFASAITTMTAGTICSAAFGDITFCSTTTVTGPLPMSLKRQVSMIHRFAGARDVRFLTLTETVI